MDNPAPVFAPRDYQDTGAHLIAAAIRAGAPELFVSPTGSGKGVIIAHALHRHPGLVCVVPSPRIAYDCARKLGVDSHPRIVTSLAYLNLIRAGTTPLPAGLLFDEGHHDDNTHRELVALTGAPHVGLTATPYCGSAEATREMRAFYGNRICTLLTLHDSVSRGITVAPSFTTVPVLDDEQLDIRSGEFVVRAASTAATTPNRLNAVVQLLAARAASPSTLVLPSVVATADFATACAAAGVPTRTIVGDTPDAARREAFDAILAPPYPVLLQVAVVTEGVDIPLRQMYDLAPTTSPRLWQQRVGRLTRPGAPSAYYSLCHNFLRHGYLWEGLVPPSAFAQAVAAWPTPPLSRRTMARALELSSLGRFTPTTLPTLSGHPAQLYAMKGGAGGLHCLAALLLAGEAAPRYYVRQDGHTGKQLSFSPRPGVMVAYPEKKLGFWRRVVSLPDCKGYSSLPPEDVSPRAAAWWADAAGRYGLDPATTPDAKQFAALPILRDNREKLP